VDSFKIEMYCIIFDIDILSAKCRVQGFTACLRQRVFVFLFKIQS